MKQEHVIKFNRIDAETHNKLISVENKQLESVICYLWINQINSQQTIDVIDAIEFNFSDGEQIVLSGNESQEGIKAIEYNFEEQKEFIEKEFHGKIKIFRINASATEMWKDVIGKTLIKAHLSIEKESEHFLSEQIILEFENKEMRLIQIHPLDGLILDYYEEI